ncbi:MAG: prephenate dehydratase [Spirochaetes bacterium]|nr:prephenate dehydratase [Spirochaetota bacterium]
MANKEDIERLDRDIIGLLSRRAELCIKDLKAEKDGNVFSAAERSRLFSMIEEMNVGPLPHDIIKKIYIDILTASTAAAAPIAVAFLGPEGTFTAIAVREFFGEAIRLLPQRTIQDVFQQVEAGAARFGVVPIENSTEGSVTFTLDELMETSLVIMSERYIRITYSLLSRGADMASIKKIFTHPQTLGQCKGWLRANIPHAEIVTVESTSRAAEIASREEGTAAISSGLAAEIYSLNTLATMIEDSRQNFTRFFLVGNEAARPTGKDKTSIVCAVKDRPGALMKLLKPFSDAGINMTRIESRPDKKKMWEYNFFIDLLGHLEDAAVRKALGAVKRETIFLKILGSYPAGS